MKQAEEALRESERRLRLALDAAGMGTFEADLAGKEAWIDAQEARLLGLPEGTQKISKEEISQRMPLEDLQTSDAKQERLTTNREAYHHEFRLAMPDGTQRWLSAYADVRAGRIFGVSFDITQRKAAEAAFREGETRLRVATAAAALGIFEWDPTTDHAVWGNDRMYEIFGRRPSDGPISKEEFVKRYLCPADLEAFETTLNWALINVDSFHATCRVRRNGSLRWLQFDGKFESAEPGAPVRLIGVVADVTARKRLEARAERFADRLATIQEQERRNLAQELHDSTVQHLVAANLAVASLRGGIGDARRSWDDLERSLSEAIKELRTFSFLLVPPDSPGHRFNDSLRRYIDGFADRAGLAVKLRSCAQVNKLALPSQRAVFRVVQEALANVYRHASASEVSVELRRTRGHLHVVVTDNGCGIRAKVEPGQWRLPEGVGIRGMKLRLTQVKGRLRIGQVYKGGTRVHAALPLG
jgi:PAS domain S-box-containing protein